MKRKYNVQAGRPLDSAPSANVIAMATKIAPLSSSPLVGPNISGLSVTQAEFTGGFVQVQILGSKFWALGGLNQKSNKKVL